MVAAINRPVFEVVQTAPRVFSRRLPLHPQCCYFAYCPPGKVDANCLFVSVHGITRNALEHALLFKPWADRYGIALVAPLFSRKNFRRYQTLNAAEGSLHADGALDLMLDDAKAIFSIPNAKTHLFGYSGGAQFAHRYTLKHPHRVVRAAFGAAGWYTFPDPALAFPYGFGAERNGQPFADMSVLARFPPSLVIVGSEDKTRDDALNKTPQIDRQQGRHRVARARRWVNAMNAAADESKLPRRCSLEILLGASHTFATSMHAHGMGKAVFEFLFDQSE